MLFVVELHSIVVVETLSQDEFASVVQYHLFFVAEVESIA